jgi:putative ABC transport system permease protein
MRHVRIEEIMYSLKNIMHRKTRSLLTVLSILIGMMAIFTLVSFGLGIGRYIDDLKTEQGADKLFIQAKGTGAPGTDPNFFISKDDVNFVEKIKGVKNIAGFYNKVGEIELKSEKAYVFVMGLSPRKIKFMEEAFAMKPVKGRSLKSGDDNKAVLGYNYQFDSKVLKKKVTLGDKILINSKPFDVIGFYEQIGNPSDDANIYITESAMESLYSNINGKYAFAIARTQKETKPEELASRITEKLRKHKGQKEGKEDFFVQTFADAIETFGVIINIINGVLILIALVSVIVAAVNIMNTMYTAVLERTKEIGVMKAIGARNSDILLIFVLEAGTLGTIGSVIGIVFGFIVSSFGGIIAKEAGIAMLRPIFPIQLVIGCILFGFIVGSLAGFLPALQASKLRPVEALRYE